MRRYPVTGRFTQEDPIGLAGGVNAYGFADGDPVNYSDPFGLAACRDDDDTCAGLVLALRSMGGKEFQRAAETLDSYQGGYVKIVPANHPDLRSTYGQVLGRVIDGRTSHVEPVGTVLLSQAQEAGDFLITTVHESYHLPPTSWKHGIDSPDLFLHAEHRAFLQLPEYFQKRAPLHVDEFKTYNLSIPRD